MIALDTNVLVYSVAEGTPEFRRAARVVRNLVESASPWRLPWPVAHEFVAVVTSPRAFKKPMAIVDAYRFITSLIARPGCGVIGEGPRHWATIEALARDGLASGAMTYDARIAAICLDNGIRELWTADRDFGRFPTLNTVNPLV